MPTMLSMTRYLKSQEYWLTKMFTYRILFARELRPVLAATLFLGLFGCTDDRLGEVPADAGVNSVEVLESDSFQIICSTEFEEPLRSDGINTALVGATTNDSLSASIYGFASELALPSGSINLPSLSNPEVKSVKLYLEFIDYYGVLEDMYIMAVVPTERLDTGEYFSNDFPDWSSNAEHTPLLQTVSPEPLNEVVVNGQTEPPSLIIDLPLSIGTKILNERSKALASNEGLREVIPAIGILAWNEDKDEGGVALVNLTGEFSRMIIEFQDDFYAADSLNDQYQLDFPIDASCARVGYFEHTWSPYIESIVSDPTIIDEFYVHSAAGLNTLIEIPELDDWKEPGSVIVNGANIRIPAKTNPVNYPVHDRLYLITRSAEGGAQFIPDIFRGPSSYGGTYDPINEEYVFNISEYIQGVIDDKFENNGLLLIDGGGYFSRVYNPRWTAVKGPQEDGTGMNFRITYSSN